MTTENESQKSITLMLKHHAAIIRNTDVIFNEPDYFFSPVECARFGSSLMQGGTLSLGGLLVLWGYIDVVLPPLPNGNQPPLWRIAQKNDDLSLHLYWVGGHLGSGANTVYGFNFETHEDVKTSVSNFGLYFGGGLSALKYIQESYPHKATNPCSLSELVEKLK